MPVRLNLIGYKNKTLRVIKHSHVDKHGKHHWECECSCGNYFIACGAQIKSRKTQSCGCLRRKRLLESNLKHGQSKRRKRSTEYNIWAGMKGRCYNKENKRFNDYGGRGIKVCKRWLSFKFFLKDMGTRPSKKHSLDRIDNNKNYSKSNCRWATELEQAINKRTTNRVMFNGELIALKTLVLRESSLSLGTVKQRYYKLKWSIEDALYKKKINYKRKH